MYHVLSGLEGAADRDRNGRVSLTELYQYTNLETKKYVARVFNDSQRPGLKGELSDDFELGLASSARLAEKLTTSSAVQAGSEAARPTEAQNNLKQIMLAMHNYADLYGSLPPAVLYGPDGKTPYSWRVALLPFLEQAPLFQQYNFNQPWDSPANKQVLAQMPPQFRDPNDAADSNFSSYFALTGPSTVFFGKLGAKFAQITDGTSNTLMVVEAKRSIPWTKPEDIPYDANKPLPKLGGFSKEGFNAAFADGSVRFISQMIDENVLRALITRAGKEVLGDF